MLVLGTVAAMIIVHLVDLQGDPLRLALADHGLTSPARTKSRQPFTETRRRPRPRIVDHERSLGGALLAGG